VWKVHAFKQRSTCARSKLSRSLACLLLACFEQHSKCAVAFISSHSQSYVWPCIIQVWPCITHKYDHASPQVWLCITHAWPCNTHKYDHASLMCDHASPTCMTMHHPQVWQCFPTSMTVLHPCVTMHHSRVWPCITHTDLPHPDGPHDVLKSNKKSPTRLRAKGVDEGAWTFENIVSALVSNCTYKI
jgi:hypothetical protein